MHFDILRAFICWCIKALIPYWPPLFNLDNTNLIACQRVWLSSSLRSRWVLFAIFFPFISIIVLIAIDAECQSGKCPFEAILLHVYCVVSDHSLTVREDCPRGQDIEWLIKMNRLSIALVKKEFKNKLISDGEGISSGSSNKLALLENPFTVFFLNFPSYIFLVFLKVLKANFNIRKTTSLKINSKLKTLKSQFCICMNVLSICAWTASVFLATCMYSLIRIWKKKINLFPLSFHILFLIPNEMTTIPCSSAITHKWKDTLYHPLGRTYVGEEAGIKKKLMQ